MLKEFLVGSTGFVGSNLAEQHQFTGLFNSKNIENAYDQEPDLLVYAGVRAEMFLANKDPEADRRHIEDAIENIRRINPKECVLISSIAVYPDTHGADEETDIDESQLSAYGANRRYLERWVEENIENHLIIRLPAIFGKGLKKNFLYDFIHRVPKMLKAETFDEMSKKAPVLREFYIDQGNGFYKCVELSALDELVLKHYFDLLDYSALRFTDSRSAYQFYDLKKLWTHIMLARAGRLNTLNLATPPISVQTVYFALTHELFENYLPKEPFDYDLHTAHCKLFGREDGYIMSATEEMRSIREFIISEGGHAV